jgi:hypothetical protein
VLGYSSPKGTGDQEEASQLFGETILSMMDSREKDSDHAKVNQTYSLEHYWDGWKDLRVMVTEVDKLVVAEAAATVVAYAAMAPDLLVLLE